MPGRWVRAIFSNAPPFVEARLIERECLHTGQRYQLAIHVIIREYKKLLAPETPGGIIPATLGGTARARVLKQNFELV